MTRPLPCMAQDAGHRRSWRPTAVLAAALALAAPVASQSLGPCPAPFDSRWECGSIPMPENRQTGVGRTIDVAVKVRRAVDGAGLAPIFVFSGGPGAPTASVATPGIMRGLADRRDLVLIDQRGTGDSNGFVCELGLDTHAARAFGQMYPMEQIAACYRTVSATSDPNQYTTGDFVADVDAVRRRLGYDRIVVMGGSYGTRSAMTYMAEYPDHVAGAVLNGVIPPDDDAPLTYARTAQEALDRVFADCAAQPDCARAYPNLRSEFEGLMARLRGQPAEVAVRRPDGTSETVAVSANDLAYAIRIILYNASYIPRLPQVLHAAATTGDPTLLAQAHYQRAVGVMAIASIGLHLSVLCAEDVPWLDDGRVGDAVEGTFLGRYPVDQYREACGRWPVERRDRRSHRAFTHDAPVLLLSGRYDPVTPEVFAERVREGFPNSRHIVKGDAGHGAGGACVERILAEFLERLDPARVTDACAGITSATFAVPDGSR